MKLSPRVLAALFAFSTGPASAATERLNILHIVSDDLNIDLGCYGNPVVKTPHLDRLVARGMRFDRAYCNYPVCNASRVSFLSGRRPETTGVLSNGTPTRAVMKTEVFLPEFFRQQGYRSIRVGKIYHSNENDDARSWDVNVREEDTAKKPPKEQILREQGHEGIVLRAKDEDTWDGIVARKAAELLEQAVRDGKPFFVAAGFRRPHSPYIAPEKYFAMYDGDTLRPRLGPPEHLKNIPDIALTYKLRRDRFPTERPGDTIAAYYASITYMDAQVGVLLDTLDRLGLWKNTIVLFHSDHGYHLGEHGGLLQKQCLFEETTKVPLIVAAPGKRSGVCNRLVELIDLYPSLAQLAGFRIPDGLEGTSFVPLLAQPDLKWKSAVFTVVTRGKGGFGAGMVPDGLGRTVFDGRWRYTEWPDGSIELYDHSHDPFEYENLARNPASDDVRAEKRRLLHNGWRAVVPGA